MKKIKFVFSLVIILITLENLSCQEISKNKIDDLIISFESLSESNAVYKLEYIEKKGTLFFKIKLPNSEEIGYKVILTDIHPEGIFTIKINEKNNIRILSVDNGHRFIKEKFRGGYRVSNTTNIIDIEILQNTNSFLIDEVIKNLKMILKEEENENVDIQIIVPKNKN